MGKEGAWHGPRVEWMGLNGPTRGLHLGGPQKDSSGVAEPRGMRDWENSGKKVACAGARSARWSSSSRQQVLPHLRVGDFSFGHGHEIVVNES